MVKMKVISILLVGALAIAGIVGVGVYRLVNAESQTQVSAPQVGFGRGPGGGYDNEELANALGITVDQLNTAYEEANQAAIEQAVEAGLITQAQADAMKEKGSGFPFGGHMGGWLSQNDINYDALLADALGITEEKLQAAYEQARDARMAQAVSDGKLTQKQADLMQAQSALFASESFQTAMQSAFEAAVGQAVSSGVITQAQADLIQQQIGEKGFFGLRGPGGFDGFGGMHGPRGGPGQDGPPDGTAPNGPPAPPATTETP